MNEKQEQAREMREEGQSYRAIANALGVAHTTVWYWVNGAGEGKRAGGADNAALLSALVQRVEQLERSQEDVSSLAYDLEQLTQLFGRQRSVLERQGVVF